MECGVKERWKDSDVFKLLSVLEGFVVNQKFDGTVRDKEVYQNIQKELEECGIYRNVMQVKNKIKNLKKMYREAKDRLRQGEEGGSSKFIYFDAVDRIYSDQIHVEPRILYDIVIETTEGEENAHITGQSDSSNMVQSTDTTGCIAIDSVTSLANVAESSTTVGCSSSAADRDLITNTNNNEELQSNEQPSGSQAKPSTSTFRTKYLNLYKMKRKLGQSSAKPSADAALQNESADGSTAQTEEENDLVTKKLKAELDVQLNADRRAQEQHVIVIRNLRREERRMIREEKRARREAVRAEKLHALKVRCLEAKIRFFESQLGGE